MPRIADEHDLQHRQAGARQRRLANAAGDGGRRRVELRESVIRELIQNNDFGHG